MPIERVEAARLQEWAKRGEQLEMRLNPAERLRLAELLFVDPDQPAADHASTDDASIDQGPLDVSVRFSMGTNRIAQVDLRVSGKMNLICQRCLGPVEWPVDVRSTLSLVTDDEQAQGLESPFDSALLDDGALVLADMIDDEILATMPLVPSHDTNEQCEPAVELTSGSEEQKDLTHKPFADLDALVKLRANRTES